MNKLMLTEDKKAKHNMLLENAIVLDCGKNTATLYDPKTDTCKIISHEDILKLPEELESGTTVVVERAHLGCPRQEYSLAQPFTEKELLDLYKRFDSNDIKLKLFPHGSTPRAISYSESKKSDFNDPKAICLLLKAFPEISMMNPKKSFEVSDILQDGWEWKDITNKILNQARVNHYEADDDQNTMYIRENIQHIYNSLSPVARDVFGLEVFKKTSKIAPAGTVKIKNINMVQIYSILAIFRDTEARLRLFRETGKFPSNNFVKKYVLCMTPNHFSGGVARSNLLHHGMKNWIIKKAKEDETINLKRKIPLTDRRGEFEATIHRGNFTSQEDAIFIKYRTQYRKSIYELLNFFKQHLISEII